MVGDIPRLPAKTLGIGRIATFDGLRGVAALVVVVFHFLAMLHPDWVSDYAQAPALLLATPLAVFWNGFFAVAVFFVLSGFVMAAAAERRHANLLENALLRYLRLALPVLASILLAYLWLRLMPNAAGNLARSLDAPSEWLAFTAQGPLPGLGAAIHDGLAGSFITGMSPFNNVLWAMQVELVGSLFLFAAYWLGGFGPWVRFAALAGFALLGLLVLRDIYLCFVTGALLYEGHKAGIWLRLPPVTGLLALALGMMLGTPGGRFAISWLPEFVPDRLYPGNPWGLAPVAGATLILLAALQLRTLQNWFKTAPLQWLGRVSFGLYLVHVPILYTFLAWERLTLGLPELLLFPAYLAAVLALAYLFTLVVDEPTLRLLGRIREQLARLRSLTRVPSLTASATAPVWPWVLLASAGLMATTLINGGVAIYYDSAIYLHRPEGMLRLLSSMPFMDLVPTDAAPAAALPQDSNTTGATAPALQFSGRSIFYQIFAWSGLEAGRLWSLAAAHAVMVAYPAALLLAHGLGRAPRWGFILGLSALGLLTPLGLSIGTAMPDILAGVLVLALTALMVGWQALRWWDRTLLLALVGFAMLSHTSHLLLAPALVIAVLLLPLRSAAMWRTAAMIGLVCTAVVGFEQLHKTLRNQGSDTIHVTRPHLTAHLVDDGPGVDYLRRACPDVGFRLCAYVDHLPIEWRDFLFGGSEPGTRFFADGPPELQKAISLEQFAFTRAVVADDPVAVLDFATAAFLRQMVMFDPAGLLLPAYLMERMDDRALALFDAYPDWMKAQLRTLAVVEQEHLLSMLHISTIGLTLLALAVLGQALYRGAEHRAQRELVLVCAALLLGVMLNAAICGVLASPYDRFQARIIWLVPLAGLALIAARRAPAARRNGPDPHKPERPFT
ncbi:MAG: putative acyltransferase [Roseibaca calidilacus]|uniref:Peptidoglycan/LPS O-acetylase OafA/YrhL, contains acyltransferase and SGNH-hydrolase domains n=1 Tax=Roseibaca calidilacus TaxID=1666912 RepID=A0A0P7WLA1_9RHOB|nr:acyltransferase [Roseibaca calidilacus]KPP91598.1 MAG: putative acyltransferase [Roseibaca calidilacus]CUX82848.1 Peptidoglycan/LPS O-acetylase OafA/YrhL, contains acyltransferase and SGNH-hydrolase domains [Roseibaca calidilacus]